MPRVELTDRFVAGAKAGDFFDAKTPGLNLRVTPSGVRSWFAVFTSPRNGKRARVSLGRYPQTKLARARTLALEAYGHVDEGQDPRDVKRALAASVLVVDDLVTSYIEKHARPNLRTAGAMERRFNKNVLPIIGGVPLAELHKREINRVIDPILERGKPVEAARCFEDVRAMFRWAVARGDLDHAPTDGMRKPGVAKARDRVLNDEEIRLLWNKLPAALPRSKAVQRILKLCLVTGQRVGEVSGMRADKLDLTQALWTIPGVRTKNKHKHSVPLTDLAIEIIGDIAGVDYVFLNGAGDGHLPAHAVAKTVTKAQERLRLPHWTSHDLRRTAVTKMAELGIAPIVLGHVINHRSVTAAGVTLSAYTRYDYAREKRAALELWAARLVAIITDQARVVPLKAPA